MSLVASRSESSDVALCALMWDLEPGMGGNIKNGDRWPPIEKSTVDRRSLNLRDWVYRLVRAVSDDSH